ncbi:MAG: hypothetical protein NZ519_02810 [Bacteroidia bacterium]|nr:hypothetical protein [Bacteroidia bacterium]MDW8301558.1 hypothetical protein [Bacteroidia bacterium]
MYKGLWTVWAAFAFSVCIRLPFLGKKLEGFGHQEWLAGHTLIILKIWQKEGIQTHHYGLPYTFYRKADKYIPFIPGIMDKKGNGYYVSYPPFAFYVLYLIISVLKIEPNELFLQIVTLLIQCWIGILIYQLLLRMQFSVQTAAFTGAAYFFLPISMRYHTQAYFCDIAAQIGIMLVLIAYQFYLNRFSFSSAVWVGLALFILTFTEWIGFFLCTTIVFYTLRSSQLSRKTKTLHILFWIFCTASGVLLTFWIYAQIAGTKALWQALLQKASQRVVADTNLYFSRWELNTYTTILHSYIAHFYPVIPAITLMWITKRSKEQEDKLKKAYIILGITFWAVILHHWIFLNFTAENDFSILKTSIVILIVWAILIEKQRQLRLSVWISSIILVANALYMTAKSVSIPKTNKIQAFASKLVSFSPSDEVLVLYSSTTISPQVMYYAERNVYMNINKSQIEQHLRKLGLKKAIMIHADWEYNIQQVEQCKVE